MGSVTYKKMSLFDAPKGTILAHGCNAQGVWGSGIAVPFKKNFPNAYKEYHDYCQHGLIKDPEHGATGTTILTSPENGHRVACLITSCNFGAKKDSRAIIVMQTIIAIKDLMSYLNSYELLTEPIYCNKFNSGFFDVPWPMTEKVLKYFAERYDLNFVVCDPDL